MLHYGCMALSHLGFLRHHLSRLFVTPINVMCLPTHGGRVHYENAKQRKAEVSCK